MASPEVQPAARRSGPLTTEAKVEKAEALKAEGNRLVKQQNYKKAIVKYSQVFAYISGLDFENSGLSQYSSALKREPLAEDLKAKCEALRVSCWSNISLCHLQLRQWDEALRYSNKVLEVDPKNVKNGFRKGQCLMELGDLERAKAIANSPNDATVLSAQRRLKGMMREQKEKEKRLYAKAFGQG